MQDQINGILLVDKPQSKTSHDIVYWARKRFQGIKIGHAGTLDPIATGLLVLLLGKATKKSQLFTSAEKQYVGQMTLGFQTDTLDTDGKMIAQMPIPQITENKVREVFQLFTGPVEQTPPMYSAIHINGKRLYQWAQKGIEVERPKRIIEIYELKLLHFIENKIDFFVHCSKGTYIRSLISDLGEKLNTLSTMSALRRVQSGDFVVENAIAAFDLKSKSEDYLKAKIIPLT